MEIKSESTPQQSKQDFWRNHIKQWKKVIYRNNHIACKKK